MCNFKFQLSLWYLVCVFQELELPYIKIAATEIVSGVSGNSEEKIRDLFDKALVSKVEILRRKYEPCREKTNSVVSEQVRHKPICTSTEDGYKLGILDLENRGIILSV